MTLVSLIIAGIAAMLLLATGIIFFVVMYQRRVIRHQDEIKQINTQKELDLIQASIQSEEKERMRIASELHDDVGATLASVKLFLYKEKGNQYNEDIIDQSKKLLDDSIKKVRDLSHNLQPTLLQHLGLELSLQSLVENIDKSGAIKARCIIQNTLPRIPDNIELAAYRISQEIINNIIKHSAADSIELVTQAGNNTITVVFRHTGAGMTQEMFEEYTFKKGATGLKNIVTRQKAIGADIKFYKDQGNDSYCTMLTIPIPANKTNNHEHY